jgi:hypothetical protein
MKLRLRPALFALALASAVTAAAQTSATTAPTLTVAPPAAPRARTSPHDTISARLDGNRVTLVYGRPYSKAPKTGETRKIWGALVPYGKVWRTGADEATLLVTEQPLKLGGATVPAGAYTLYTLPAADGTAQLLISKKIGQWGADPYDEKQELARVPLTKAALAEPVDQFTMTLDKDSAGGGFIRLIWEQTQFSVPYAVKK